MLERCKITFAPGRKISFLVYFGLFYLINSFLIYVGFYFLILGWMDFIISLYIDIIVQEIEYGIYSFCGDWLGECILLWDRLKGCWFSSFVRALSAIILVRDFVIVFKELVKSSFIEYCVFYNLFSCHFSSYYL